MQSKFAGNISKKATTIAVIGAIGVAMFLGSGAAHAQDNKVIIGNGTGCEYGGVVYPEGTIIKIGHASYVCLAGKWEDAPEAATGVQASRENAGVLVNDPPKKQRPNVSRAANLNLVR